MLPMDAPGVTIEKHLDKMGQRSTDTTAFALTDVVVPAANRLGEEGDGFKIAIAPFAEDPSASKMQGFHKSAFTIVVSNQVPGFFVDLESNFVSSEAAGPGLKEHIKVVSMGEAK